ncbi:MAG: hypothetical protein ACI9G1_000125 [Pirellulaceae bacterium]|jgi:hypothetical protein
MDRWALSNSLSVNSAATCSTTHNDLEFVGCFRAHLFVALHFVAQFVLDVDAGSSIKELLCHRTSLEIHGSFGMDERADSGREQRCLTVFIRLMLPSIAGATIDDSDVTFRLDHLATSSVVNASNSDGDDRGNTVDEAGEPIGSLRPQEMQRATLRA